MIDLAALVQVRFSVQYEAIISDYLYTSILLVQDFATELLPPASRLFSTPPEQPLLIVAQDLPVDPLAPLSEDSLKLNLQQNFVFIP